MPWVMLRVSTAFLDQAAMTYGAKWFAKWKTPTSG
jgi:hypothetical protein